MQLVSVNVSPGVLVQWHGETVCTGIFKQPVAGRVMVRRTNLDGDRQADLRVHGGEFKAVYAYALEHYEWWQHELQRELPYGMFGDNLTIQGFTDESVCVGDRFRAGGALLEAVQPRLPCFKLGIRFNDDSMLRRFQQSGRFGVYCRVLEEGDVGAGDSVTCVHRDEAAVPVPALVRLLETDVPDPIMLERALSIAGLPPNWRQKLQRLRAGAPRRAS
jgi:MOSC domain-containing protein YiiM